MNCSSLHGDYCFSAEAKMATWGWLDWRVLWSTMWPKHLCLRQLWPGHHLKLPDIQSWLCGYSHAPVDKTIISFCSGHSVKRQLVKTHNGKNPLAQCEPLQTSCMGRCPCTLAPPKAFPYVILAWKLNLLAHTTNDGVSEWAQFMTPVFSISALMQIKAKS